eukprot:TRINITY_DN5895_c0_g1_i3.p1 TRINITY_DN5895_c0_g1~~TRINITY_DN5895_c0_g1_i3.p1  ORF type:complete len:172 (-),score=21.37 TRINITY_DN5895_c0_g1_i3:370-885(-)
MWMLRPTRVWRRAAPTQGGISSSMIEAVPLRCIEALERRRDATMHAAMHDHTVKMLDTLEASTVESASTDAPGDEDACEDELSSASEDSSHDDATSSFAATKGFWEDLGSGSDPDEQDYLALPTTCGRHFRNTPRQHRPSQRHHHNRGYLAFVRGVGLHHGEPTRRCNMSL